MTVLLFNLFGFSRFLERVKADIALPRESHIRATGRHLSGAVEIDEFAVFPLPYLLKFQK